MEATTHPVEGTPIGYLELVRTNRDFRNLWLGQVVSELGDWFSIIAIFNLLLELTHRAQALGWFLIVIHLPTAVVGPIAGILVDRLDRKRLMIITDLIRAALLLAYLFIRRADQIWIVYLIAALEVSMMTLFEPARTASIPNICQKRELVAANALGSVTWSAMLMIGAALGGFVAAAFGREFCFVIDSLSFVFSAFLIGKVNIPHRINPGGAYTTAGRALTSGLRDMRDGFRYMKSNPPVSALLLVKTGWCLGGGILLVLGVFGQSIYPVLGSGAAGIGVLYAARGIGTAMGPIVARRLAGENQSGMRKAIAAGFFTGSVFYIIFGQIRWQPLATLAMLMAHMGGSITWVFSTVLLQLKVPDEFRGRVFAIEFALLTLGIALSSYVTGFALDELRLDPRLVASMLGLYFLFPGILWLSAQHLYRK